MVTVTEIKDLCDQLKNDDPRIKNIVLVANEGHLVNKLKDKKGVILACIYPSADRNGQPNEAMDVNSLWFFILEKDVAGQSDSAEEAQFGKLQEITLDIRDYVEDTAVTVCSFLSRHQPSGTQIIPEWREFGGFNGWSMSLVF
jgi:hypothetical protein